MQDRAQNGLYKSRWMGEAEFIAASSHPFLP